jgi:hypothetical protein
MYPKPLDSSVDRVVAECVLARSRSRANPAERGVSEVHRARQKRITIGEKASSRKQTRATESDARFVKPSDLQSF